MTTIATVILAYLLGCVNTGFYLVRARTGEDLRALGSGTLGARNSGRVLGRLGFVVVLVGDVGKGLVAVALAGALAPVAAPVATPASVAAVAAVAVVLGHVLPVQLRFRGGKGLATSLGATAGLSPVVALAGLGVAAVGVALSRRAGASSLAGVVAAPVAALLWLGPGAEAAALAAIAGIVLLRHAPPVVARLAPPAYPSARPPAREEGV